MTGMALQNRMEQFSHAYIRAVCSVAGFAVGRPEVDDDSVDLTVYCRGPRGTVRSPRLDLQAKSTSRAEFASDRLAFDLKQKNYNDLRWEDVAVPRILVVVVLPERTDEWLEQDPERMLLRRCGYWCSLRGLPESSNLYETRVSLPSSQVFSVAALQGMMDRIGEGRQP